MNDGEYFNMMLADSTLKRLAIRINKKFPYMSEEDLAYIFRQFENTNRIQISKLKGETNGNNTLV